MLSLKFMLDSMFMLDLKFTLSSVRMERLHHC